MRKRTMWAICDPSNKYYFDESEIFSTREEARDLLRHYKRLFPVENNKLAVRKLAIKVLP